MSQSMNDYYTDFEELRPIGEASHIPDEKLSECGDSAAHRQRVATTEKGYPNDATESNTECRSCGASVPDGQTKCRFCLTNHLESDAASTNESASTTFLGIIHLIVESTTFYGAVAKGGAAANLLSANQAEPAVDDYTLIYDLDGRRRASWPSNGPHFPTRYRCRQRRERAFSAARDRTGWAGGSVGASGAGPNAALRPTWGRHPRRVAS